MAVSVTTALEAEFTTGVWTDITADVTKNISVDRGLQGSAPKDRVATTGTMKFELINSASNSGGLQGYYSPGHTNCRTGFEEGLAVRLKLTYGVMVRYKFYGKITDIQPMPGIYKNQLTMVTACDYINELARHKLDGVAVQTSKTGDQVLAAVVANIPTAPLNTRYDTGTDTFAYALGSERDEVSTALSVAQKIAQSELSRIYVVGNPTDGETLVYENRHNQIIPWVTPTDIPAVEAAGLKWLYDETAGLGWTDNTNWGKTTTANDWYGITVAGGKVTDINIDNNNLVGSVATFPVHEFTAMTLLYLQTNSSLTGDISGWTFPSTLQYLSMDTTGLSGEISVWTIPTSLKVLSLHTNSFTGDISGWTIPASMESLYIHLTGLSNVPVLSSMAAIQIIYYQCSLSQAHVDAFLLALYTEWATGSLTHATPELYMGGTNTAPGGAYADEDPPTTGLGAVYEICNDPESTGYNTWAVTVTGSGPYP